MFPLNRTQIRIIVVIISFFLLNPATASPMTIFLKEGVREKQGMQRWVESHQTDDGTEKSAGSKEIERQDGHKDKVYYSGTTKEEEAEGRQEEKGKIEKSWDMLRNMILIPKRTR
jgi:hypothetical protein